LTAGGGLDVAGLEWLGKRAYDPAVRGFLSTDPLEPVLGAGWDGNPYSYAGNNPLHATDPTGLRPMTDEELKAYDQQAGSHWETILGAVAVAGAIAVMFVPGVNIIAAGAIAGALAAGGMSMISQDMQSGTVDWWQVVGSAAAGAAIGAVGAGISSGVSAVLGRVASSQATNAASALGNMGRAAVSHGVSGAVTNTGVYLATKDPSEWSGREIAGAAIGGAVTGAVSSQATIVSGGMNGVSQTIVRNVVAGGGSVAGGTVDNLISGSEYTPQEMVIDAAGGAALSHLPSATKLAPSTPGWSHHAVDGFLGSQYNFAAGVAEQTAVKNGVLSPQ